MQRQSGGGIGPRRVVRRVLFVLGGTVATTAAAWAIGTASASSATHLPTPSSTHSLEEHAAFAQAHPESGHVPQPGKLPQNVTNQILSTVGDVGKPLGKTAVTAVKDVATTADKTIRAATAPAAPINSRPPNGNSTSTPPPSSPAGNIDGTAHNTANAAADGVSTTVRHLGGGLGETMGALGHHVDQVPVPPQVGKVTGVLDPGQGNKFDPIMNPGTPTGVITAPATPAKTTPVTASAPAGALNPSISCPASLDAKHGESTGSDLPIHGLSRGGHHLPPVHGPPAPDTIPATGGTTGGSSASTSSPALDMPLVAGYERPAITTIDTPADEVPPASTTHRPGCSPD